MRFYSAGLLLFVCALAAQDVRPKDVRDLGKAGAVALPRLGELLTNSNTGIRVETVRQITAIGTLPSLDLLIKASHDNDPEVQMHATDGLVNFYLPGYAQSGFAASLKRVGTNIKGRFTDTNDQAIEAFITVRPDVVTAIAALVSGGGSMDVRANAARAAGILRGQAALPDLLAALRTKNTDVMYESLNAIQKIRDESAGPRITFLLRDPDARVQIAAVEAVGILHTREAAPDLMEAMRRARDAKVRRAIMGSLAMLPDEKLRPIYQQYLEDKDDKLRAAAAEGFGRLKNRADLPMLEKAYKEEGKTPARLSLAFAQVNLGKTGMSEFSPLQYLVNTLNSAAYKGEARPFLEELARESSVREALYPAIAAATRDEKVGLARVLARSGDRESLPYLEKLSRDSDPEVAQEGIRAVRNLQARL